MISVEHMELCHSVRSPPEDRLHLIDPRPPAGVAHRGGFTQPVAAARHLSLDAAVLEFVAEAGDAEQVPVLIHLKVRSPH